MWVEHDLWYIEGVKVVLSFLNIDIGQVDIEFVSEAV